MKKLFTLMLAFACALFVGVSCTTDDTIGDTPIPTIPVVKVNGLVIGTPNAGTCDLAYVIENAQDGVDIKVEVDEKGAEWLTAEAVDEKVVLTYTENLTDKSRVATLYLSYGAAETVHVTVKQVGQVYLEVLGIPETGVVELEPFGGEFVLNYVMHTENPEAVLSATVSEGATWLKAEVAAEVVTLKYEGNADVAREATVELSFEGVEPVVVAVKQAVAVSTLAVSGTPEANLSGAAGSFNLVCKIDKIVDVTIPVVVSTEADWLHIGDTEDGETYPITYDANINEPGSEPREGVIKFSYKNAEDVLVTVKQEPQPAMFNVACNQETLSCGQAEILVSAVDPEMLYLAVTSQELGQYGVMGENKVELMNNYMTLLASNNMLYGQPDYWFVYKGNMADAGVSKQASRYTAEEKVTVYVVGFTPVTTMEVEEGGEKMVFVTEAKLATSIIEYEVPFLPYPTLTVPEAQLSHNVTSAAGEVVVDCVLTNPLADGTAVEFQTEAAWVHPTWADNKLTIAYDANTTAVARRAKIAVMYGYYTNPFEITVVQDKDPNAVAVTLTITVKGTQFDGILVDVVPSDATATYALNITTPEKDWETGAELPIDWMVKAESLLSYVGNETFHKGALTNYFIKTNVANYKSYGYDHYVYAIPVEATSEETTDYWGNPKTEWTVSQILGEVAVSEKVTIDVSKMPKVDWVVEGSGLVWNENAERYDLEVVEGSTVTLSFTVENPVEGATLKLNGSSLNDSFNVVDGEPVIDNAAGTITFKIDAFDTSKNYHYVRSFFKYTNEADDNWGIMLPDLQLTQVQAPATDTPATPAE